MFNTKRPNSIKSCLPETTSLSDQCRHIVTLISADVDGEASPKEHASVVAHVRSCNACASLLESMKRTKTVLSASKMGRLPEDFDARLRMRVQNTSGAAKLSWRLADTMRLAGGYASEYLGGMFRQATGMKRYAAVTAAAFTLLAPAFTYFSLQLHTQRISHGPAGSSHSAAGARTTDSDDYSEQTGEVLLGLDDTQ